MIGLTALLILAILLQGTVTTVPLAVIVFLCIGILRRDRRVFMIGFFAGIFVDILSLHPLGTTSLFLIISSFLMFLYQRKYEINSLPFLLFSSFFGAFIYLSILNAEYVIFNTILSTILGGTLFSVLRIFLPHQESHPQELIAPKEGIHFRR